MAGLSPLPQIPFLPVPLPNVIPGNPNDSLVKDKKVHASQLVSGAGWSGGDVRIATAIMGAESSYNPNADNGICCVGLMQVNLNHAGSFGIPADTGKAKDWLKDPENNVNASHKIFLAQGWDAWETYTNGSYKNFLGRDPLITVHKGTVTGSVTDAAGSAVDAALGPVDEIAGALLNPSTWLRIGKGWLGAVFIITGTGAIVFVLANKASKSPAVHKVAKTAVKAAALA